MCVVLYSYLARSSEAQSGAKASEESIPKFNIITYKFKL